jgi:hypothetical protein
LAGELPIVNGLINHHYPLAIKHGNFKIVKLKLLFRFQITFEY